MPYVKVQAERSAMNDRSQLDSRKRSQTLAIREEARRRQKDVKRKMKKTLRKQRVIKIFIL